jgi:Zn-dependent protease
VSGINLSSVVTCVILLMIAFPVHEFAHAWTANYFGDDTPRLYGRLTLNPLAHLDLIGSLMLIGSMLVGVGIGWAKPVPVDPYALRRKSPAALMWVSLAGPASNFLMALLAAIPFRLGLVSTAVVSSGALVSLPAILDQFILINLSLMLFNLIPLAPLDGEKVLEYFLPPNLARNFESIRPYGPMILMALIALSYARINIFSYLIYYPAVYLHTLLVG